MSEKVALGLVLLTFILVGTPAVAQPTTKLDENTASEFENYRSRYSRLIRARLAASNPSIWPKKIQESETSLLRQGEILVHPEEGVPSLKGGLIQEWYGAVMIPSTKVVDVEKLLLDYGHQPAIFPEIVEARSKPRGENHLWVFLRIKKENILTVVVDTTYDVFHESVGNNRGAHIWSKSSKIQEVRDAGTQEERKLPVGNDSGFLWRLDTDWYLRQVGQDVLAECSTLTLSRSIPFGLGFIIKPIIHNFPRETMTSTLTSLRDAATKASQ